MMRKDFDGHSSWPVVLVVVPALNEAAFIESCVASLLAQDYEGKWTVAVMDGGSSDDTFAIALKLTGDGRVLVRDNPDRTQAAALNMAALAKDMPGTILMRADAHSDYQANFISSCVRALIETGAQSVVTPMKTVGRLPFQRAAAAAQNSLLGNGGSAHRQQGRSGFVDHGHHAAFRRDMFVRLGGYSLDFTHNEDAEFDHRLTRDGGKIWLCADAVVTYYPRSEIRSLAQQYLNYGRGRAKNILKHGTRPKLRQLAPVVIATSGAVGLALVPVVPLAGLIPAAYLLMYAGWSIVAALRARDPALLAMGAAAATMHFSWAQGFILAFAKSALAGELRQVRAGTA